MLRERAQQVRRARRDRARRCQPRRPSSSCLPTRHATPTTAGRTLRVDDLFGVASVCSMYSASKCETCGQGEKVSSGMCRSVCTCQSLISMARSACSPFALCACGAAGRSLALLFRSRGCHERQVITSLYSSAVGGHAAGGCGRDDARVDEEARQGEQGVQAAMDGAARRQARLLRRKRGQPHTKRLHPYEWRESERRDRGFVGAARGDGRPDVGARGAERRRLQIVARCAPRRRRHEGCQGCAIQLAYCLTACLTAICSRACAIQLAALTAHVGGGLSGKGYSDDAGRWRQPIDAAALAPFARSQPAW